MKKSAQRRHKQCTLAVVRRSQKFLPAADPLPGLRDSRNLISWRWPLPINPVWWGSMHTISSYCGNRPTNTHTQIGPITVHCATASAQCNYTLTPDEKWVIQWRCVEMRYQMQVCRSSAWRPTRSSEGRTVSCWWDSVTGWWVVLTMLSTSAGRERSRPPFSSLSDPACHSVQTTIAQYCTNSGHLVWFVGV